MALFRGPNEDVRLERWSPGADIALAPQGGLELLLLEGSFEEAGEAFAPLSWLRLPVGTPLRALSGPEGCRVWVKEGHLAKPRRNPKF